MHSSFIALLRGINVSGQKKILMSDLRQVLHEIGFNNIQTYIQSGNIILSSEASAEEIRQRIQQKILEKYNFEVGVFVLTPEEIQKIINQNPFAQDEEKDVSRTYVTFLEKVPTNTEALEESNYPPEEFVLKGKIIYFYSPESYGKAKMNNNFFEKKLKLQATTRNWKTVNKLLEMVGK